MELYKEGRKWVDDGVDFIPVEGITVIGVENPVEYTLKENAPTPFIYGVKTICISRKTVNGDQVCVIYDVLKGEYREDVTYKGDDWLNAIPETANTLDDYILENVSKNFGGSVEDKKFKRSKRVTILGKISELKEQTTVSRKK